MVLSPALRRLDGRPKANDTDALNARMLGSPLLACFRIICSGLPAVVVCSSGAMCKVPFIQQQGNIHLIFYLLCFILYYILAFWLRPIL